MAGFDASLIAAGPAGFGQGLSQGIADLRKKREHEEEQMAYNQTAYQTLVDSGVLTEEERQKFTSGNLNAKNGIVAAGGARLIQKLRTEKEQEARDIQRQALQMRQAYYERNSTASQQPQIDPATGLYWNGRQWVKPPTQNNAWAGAIPIARGTLRGGEFYNNYAGAENGDQIQLQLPHSKEPITVPFASWQAHTGQQPVAPVAPMPAYQPAPTPETVIPNTQYAPSLAKDKFVVGKKYKDASGNMATYMGNGQWQ